MSDHTDAARLGFSRSMRVSLSSLQIVRLANGVPNYGSNRGYDPSPTGRQEPDGRCATHSVGRGPDGIASSDWQRPGRHDQIADLAPIFCGGIGFRRGGETAIAFEGGTVIPITGLGCSMSAASRRSTPADDNAMLVFVELHGQRFEYPRRTD